MSQPIQLSGNTARFALPYLFAGQAQKEFFVNEAHARLDTLLHPAVEGETSTPPTNPTEGQAWLVDSNAAGDWAGRDGQLAGYQGGTWLFFPPEEGMHVWDKAADQTLVYDGSWKRPSEPAPVNGGSVVDSELRTAFANLVEALRISGVFAN